MTLFNNNPLDNASLNTKHPLTGLKLGIAATAIMLVYFCYFLFTSYHLPAGAGPDYPLSQEAVRFYMQHERLAVMPQDADIVKFSQFGDSRALRPPLSFATAALLAKASPFLDSNWRFAFRHGSALFSALTVMLVFLGLYLYLAKFHLALLGANLLALMPQFTFTASYLNDDSAAIFAATLLFYAMLRIYKKGVSSCSLALFGLSLGVAIISKQTAWLLFPGALLFYFMFVFRLSTFIKHALLIAVFLILGGGWWCLHNIWHYGLNDPFLFKLMEQLRWQYATVDLHTYGFAKQGIGFYDLLLHNYRDFIGATFKAVVGHLDWLRLRVTDVQYDFYLIFVVFAIAALVCQFTTSLLRLVRGEKQNWPALGFDLTMVVLICTQILLYTRHNIHNDIQIQGKYLLPVMFPCILLAIRFIALLINKTEQALSSHVLYNNLFKATAIMAMLILPVVVHVHAVYAAVIPFYWPELLAN